MTYNLLNYRNNTTTFCSNTNNNPTTKENALKTIIDFTLPDILVCNEIGGSSSVNAFRILSNSLNQNGRSYYDFTNSTGINQSLVNMIYFDSSKVKMYSQDVITQDVLNVNIVRLIDVYTLYYNDATQLINADTTFITVIAAHLKAGNSSADELQRERATEAVMAYLDSNNAVGNYIFTGDLNLYSSSENAYQNLLNYTVPSLRFYDPINVAGSWSNDARFASIHTQSTRTIGGCGAGGGMDDRFDFILVSDEIMNNTDKVEYISGSYRALGQDGLRFNGSITNPINNSVPSNISQALEDVSDHLPVVLDLEISLNNSTNVSHNLSNQRIKYNNPINSIFNISFPDENMDYIELQILDEKGQIVFAKDISEMNQLSINTEFLNKSFYFLKLISKNGLTTVKKLIKI